jgi:hypothetical protein
MGAVPEPDANRGYRYEKGESHAVFDLEYIVNYVTPGYATAVYVSASRVERIRTTAESHRRIAIIEVMGRRSGYITLGSAYGRSDIILVPEHPLDIEHLVERVKHQQCRVYITVQFPQRISGRRVRCEPVPRPLGLYSCQTDVSAALRPKTDDAFTARNRLFATYFSDAVGNDDMQHIRRTPVCAG